METVAMGFYKHAEESPETAATEIDILEDVHRMRESRSAHAELS
jgi:hypothetical protein